MFIKYNFFEASIDCYGGSIECRIKVQGKWDLTINCFNISVDWNMDENVILKSVATNNRFHHFINRFHPLETWFLFLFLKDMF